MPNAVLVLFIFFSPLLSQKRDPIRYGALDYTVGGLSVNDDKINAMVLQQYPSIWRRHKMLWDLVVTT